MFAVLFALSSAALPAATEAAATCLPQQQSGCVRAARPIASAVRPGKRCHPDPTKSKSCREVLPDHNARKDAAALADAR